MILKVVCVRDRATDQFGTPLFMVSIGQAIRSFSDEVNRADKDNQLYRHPEDFDLFELGEFDTQKGTFAVHAAEQIAIGKSVALGESAPPVLRSVQ